MAFNVKLLARSIIDAAKVVAGEVWPEMQDVAEAELRRLAQCAEDIEGMLRRGRIDAKRARMLFEIQRQSVQTALLTAESLTASASDEVMETVVGLIGKAINRTGGINLF